MEILSVQRRAYSSRDIEILRMAAVATFRSMILDGQEGETAFSFSVVQRPPYVEKKQEDPIPFLVVQGLPHLVRRFVRGFEAGQQRDIELIDEEVDGIPKPAAIRRHPTIEQPDLPFQEDIDGLNRFLKLSTKMQEGIGQYMSRQFMRRTEIVRRTIEQVIRDDLVQSKLFEDHEDNQRLLQASSWNRWQEAH